LDLPEPSTKALRHYYNAANPSGIRDVREYQTVRIRNVYPGIDWIVRMAENGLKYDFEAAAGADVSVVRMRYRGADELSLRDGKLHARCRLGTLTEQAPVVTQGERTVESAFALDNGDVVFNIDAFDSTKPLRIDPEMVWGTFYGGNLTDQFIAVTTDNTGNTIVTGYTASPNFPLFSAGYYYDNSFAPFTDAVIVKFNSNLQMVWSTFYGGTGTDRGCGVAVDANNNLFVTGYTASSDMPTQDGGGYFDGTFNGQDDGFMLKFDATSALLWATYVGGASTDRLLDLALDPSGNVFVTGHTLSTGFPTQASGGAYFDGTNAGNDGLVMKFGNTGALLWSTFFGGSSNDEPGSISVDASGNVFLAGYTSSSDFPTMNAGTYFSGTSSGGDAFISKFSSGLSLTWSTFYGGGAEDRALHTALDADNNLFVSGYTISINFPTYATGTAYLDNVLNTGSSDKYDQFFLKFSNSGVRLWATYFGGVDHDGGGLSYAYTNDGLRCDPCGNTYGTFPTFSTDVPTANPGCNAYYDDNLSHSGDVFFVKFKRNLGLHWGTYFGGAGWEDAFALTLNNDNTLIVAGSSPDAFGIPVEQFGAAYFDNSPTQQDAFLAAFEQPDFDPALNYSLCTGACTGMATVDVNTDCAVGYTYQWSNGVTTNAASGLCAGAYQVTVTDTLHCYIDTLSFTLAGGIEIAPVVDAVSCNLACTGAAEVSVPGTSGLTYAWSNGFTTASVIALCPGNYTVTVTAPGCGSDVASFAVVLPPPLIILLNSVQDPQSASCAGTCNGQATVMLNGGATMPFAVWSNGETGTVADSLCPGQTYMVTASDSLCYTTSIPVVIPPAPPLDLYMFASPGCGCDNSATVQVLNGTSYTYLWSTGDTTQTITGCPGTYSVTVTDSICGIATATINLDSIPPPLILSFDTEVPPCPPCSATAMPYVQYGGWVAGYQWSTGATTGMASGLCVGETYYLTVTNICGHVDVDSVAIPGPPPMAATAGMMAPTCPDSCTGSGQASAQYAVPPLTFLWNTGETTSEIAGLCAGSTYEVIVTDACGQIDSAGFTFPFPVPVEATANATYPGCPGSCDAQATVGIVPFTGMAPFTYAWSSGTTESTAFGLCVDSTYTVTVTDWCGTTSEAAVTIPRASAI
ncbi:MAG TPA: SBBP repeat-containing protein, partial [Chitinophagales bacterium]|nr:SBBP repeat-containing protein [Chitinophagales bacterium]